jgi:hypothetical protein
VAGSAFSRRLQSCRKINVIFFFLQHRGLLHMSKPLWTRSAVV